MVLGCLLLAGMMSCTKHYSVAPVAPRPPATFTSTLPPTATSTATLLFSSTFTTTRTFTGTVTPTQSFTRTSSPSPTNSWTAMVPTHTSTFTTSTTTQTFTRTFTPTQSFTRTSSPSPTNSWTVVVPTHTSTFTGTPPPATHSSTPTPTPSFTRTFTRTSSPTFTATVTETLPAGATHTFTPTGTNETSTFTATHTATETGTTGPPCAATYTFGNLGPGAYIMADGGYIDASPAALSEPATVFRINILLQNASGNVAVALYSNNAGAPGTLITASTAQPALEGWNPIFVPSVVLSPDTYWLAAQVEGATNIVIDATASAYWAVFPFSNFPASYPTGTMDTSYRLIIYADYCRDSSLPTNTPTVTGTPTDTPTETPTAVQPWTELTDAASFSTRNKQSSVSFGGSLWLAGGVCTGDTLNDVFSSADGATWTQVTASAAFPSRQDFGMQVHDDGAGSRLWIFGGWSTSPTATLLSDVWTSTDGATWNEVTVLSPFTPRASFGSAVHDEDGAGPEPAKLWVVGGWNGTAGANDVWSSPDGATWTQVSASTSFSPRYFTRCVSYNGLLWMTGGFDGYGYMNDVWSSADGVAWTMVTNGAAFPGRIGHTLEVFDDGSGPKLWIVGGYNGTLGFLNDTWASSDGETWTLMNNGTGFSPRAGHSSAVFNGHLFTLAGWDADPNCTNDVWQLP